MLRHTFRYLFIPAIALLMTMQIYVWVNEFLYGDKASNGVKSSGEALIGGAFKLTNQHGKVVQDTDFAGKFMLVYFGFSNCPMICPTDMAVITQALETLGDDAKKIQPVFITIDPMRDDVSQLKAFVSNFYPTFQALTGTPEEIANVANAYRVFYKKVEAEDLSGYLMDHSAYMYLMGHDGKYITHFRHEQPAEEIVAGIGKFL